MSSENGPVYQTVIPSEAAPEPVKPNYSNFGGVLRVTTGSEQDAQALKDFAAEYGRQERSSSQNWTSTATSHGQVQRATYQGGEASFQTTEAVSRSTSGGPQADASDITGTIRSQGGRPLTGSEVTRSSLIDIAPGVTTSVGVAVAMGLLRMNPSTGLYEDPKAPTNGARPMTAQESRAEQLRRDQQELQDRADAKREAEEAGDLTNSMPAIEPMNDEAEAIMSEASQKLGGNNLDVAQATREAITAGAISPDLQARLASQLGVSPEAFAGQYETVRAGLEEQARGVFKGGMDEIVAWATNAIPREVEKAQHDHVTLGTTRGYATIQQAYMEQLADTAAGRAAIKASGDAKARGIYEDTKTGKLMVTLPKVGPVEWRVAVKQGFIAPSYK